MKKNTMRTNITQIKKYSSRMPKTINEAINFNEEYDDMEMDMDMMDNEPMEDRPVKDDNMDVMAFVDDIRKKSLKGMAQLAENPDDERYQLLKKIWQICDKKPEQQQQQPNNPQQRPM